MLYQSLLIVTNIMLLPMRLSATLYCNTPFQCIDAIDRSEDVRGYGYRSISGRNTSVTLTSGSSVYCYAAFACESISFIIVSGNVWCDGSNSCRHITSIVAKNQYLSCRGSNSCAYSKLRIRGTGATIECSGDQSCAYSHIENSSRVIGSGAYSLMHSVIKSKGTMNVSLKGYNAGFGTNITCRSVDICYIECEENGCYMTYLDCKGINSSNCIVINISKSTRTIQPIVNINTVPWYQLIVSSFNLLYNSQTLTTNNEKQCNYTNYTAVYDNYQQHKQAADILVTEEPVCCRGVESCHNVSTIQLNTTTQHSNYSIVCSGQESCSNQDVGKHKVINNNGAVFCEGQAACYGAKITTTNDVYCLGQRSCRFSRIYGAQNVYCAGAQSCSQAVIRSDGNNITVHLLATSSAQQLDLRCGDTDNCTVRCGVFDECAEATLNGNVAVMYAPILGYDSYETTDISTTPIIDMIDVIYNDSGTCSNQYNSTGYIDTEYQISTTIKSCIDGIIEFISYLIYVIDITYAGHDLFVHSNITKETRAQLAHIDEEVFCGHITFHIVTCFDEKTNETKLRDITESEEFLEDVIFEIYYIYNHNDTVIYIKNTTVIYIIDIIDDDVDDVLDHKDPIYWMIILLIAGSITLCVMIIFIIRYYRNERVKERSKKAMRITNGMVILIAIGDYDDLPSEPSIALRDVTLPDFDLTKDVVNVHKLFGKQNLNFTIYPHYEDVSNPRLHWAQREIIDLLEAKAEELDTNRDYDGLIVIISSHGIQRHICCSDYRLIEKLAIHRIFTKNHSRTREIPRIFLFDGCEGEQEMDGYFGAEYNDDEDDDNDKGDDNVKDRGKYQESDIAKHYSTIWGRNTKSPDYRLAVINGSIPGFQSKLNAEIGSYMLHGFTKKTLEDLNANDGRNDRFFGEIMDEVQQELETRGKQHIQPIYMDMTRWIRFVKQDVAQSDININDMEVQMMQLSHTFST